jgi:hypothetical protein
MKQRSRARAGYAAMQRISAIASQIDVIAAHRGTHLTATPCAHFVDRDECAGFVPAFANLARML